MAPLRRGKRQPVGRYCRPLAFPDLVQRYEIKGVPFAVINEEFRFYAAVPEDEFLKQLTKATS